jgi:hypothetical protein
MFLPSAGRSHDSRRVLVPMPVPRIHSQIRPEIRKWRGSSISPDIVEIVGKTGRYHTANLFHIENSVAVPRRQRHDQRMNSARLPSTTPDPFSATSGPAPFSPSPPASSSSVISHATETVRSSRHVLPKDLETAIKRLDDQELDRLSAAVFAEQKRRGRKTSESEARASKRQIESIAVPLTQGKLNAVRAAFKAGVTPSRIARQFGISQSNVRKALASDEKKR